MVRRWEAMVARSDLAGWLEAFQTRVYPKMQAISGFEGISVLAQRGDDPCRITVLTHWRDEDALRAFAGDAPQKAVVPDYMEKFFQQHDAEATFHDQIMVEAAQ